MTAPGITVAYVTKGFLERIRKEKYGVVERFKDQAGIGEIEVFSYLVDAAEAVEQVWQKRFAEDHSYDRVWDYEVSEYLGIFIAEHLVVNGGVPHPGAIVIEVNRLASKNALDGIDGYAPNDRRRY